MTAIQSINEMSSDSPQPEQPARRLSTGGLPPIRLHYERVIEPAPSHDGTPCLAAWRRQLLLQVPRGWQAADFSIADTLPPGSVQVYDTTPGSDDPDTLHNTAEMVYAEADRIYEEQQRYDCEDENRRIDVWGLPLSLPAGMSDEERARRCKDHCLAEIASREGASDPEGEVAFGIPRIDGLMGEKRALLVLDRSRGAEEEGGVLLVYWDADGDEDEGFAGEGEGEETVRKCTLAELGENLWDLRDGIRGLGSF